MTDNPIPVIYEAKDLRRIAALMDAVSVDAAPLRVEGEAFVIRRSHVYGTSVSEERWETSVEFYRSVNGWPETERPS